MINKTLKKFILQERYFSKSIERSIIKFLDCKDSYVKGKLAEDIKITYGTEFEVFKRYRG